MRLLIGGWRVPVSTCVPTYSSHLIDGDFSLEHHVGQSSDGWIKRLAKKREHGLTHLVRESHALRVM
jgi:hypothetical protein